MKNALMIAALNPNQVKHKPHKLKMCPALVAESAANEGDLESVRRWLEKEQNSLSCQKCHRKDDK